MSKYDLVIKNGNVVTENGFKETATKLGLPLPVHAENKDITNELT